MFSERLVQSIKDKGVTKYKIAKDTKITQATLSNYCKGKGSPSPSIVKQLSTYLRVNYKWLLAGEGSKDDPDEETFISDTNEKYETKNQINLKEMNKIISYYENQIDKKDELITRLTAIIEEKIDILLQNYKNNEK